MCFSIDWFVHLLIVLIIICAVVAVLRIWVFPLLPDARIAATLNIIIGVIIAIFVIYVCVELLECALIGWPSGRLR
jgi:hypothetical protein